MLPWKLRYDRPFVLQSCRAAGDRPWLAGAEPGAVRGDAQRLRHRPGLPTSAGRRAGAVQGSPGLASGQSQRRPGPWCLVGAVRGRAAQWPGGKAQHVQPDRGPGRSPVPSGPGLGAQCPGGVFPLGGPDRRQEPLQPGHRQQQFKPEQFGQRYPRHLQRPGRGQLGSRRLGQAAAHPGGQ
ncbi:hypothetical protein SRABI112_01813 [Pseudomonas mediterranea]|nr:hypothetical protein SRABI112_01813 [Pseudomonas mediterranea]